jgi:hypothetical protein
MLGKKFLRKISGWVEKGVSVFLSIMLC